MGAEYEPGLSGAEGALIPGWLADHAVLHDQARRVPTPIKQAA